jgi:hypothetical protein
MGVVATMISDRFNDFPKALNEWQSKLYDLGYPGPYDLGSMVRAVRHKWRPRDCDELGDLTVQITEDEFFAGYVTNENAEFDHELTRWSFRRSGDSPEEAVANLMIEHPELWKKP